MIHAGMALGEGTGAVMMFTSAGYGNEHLWTERYLLRNRSRTI
ncbi:MAG: hypothetical protein ACLTAX_15835 [Waltera sp.]